MATELLTPRLRLRLWRDDDLGALAHMNANADFTRYVTLDGRPMTRTESEAHLARLRAHWEQHGFGTWAMEERATGRLVGRSGVAFHRLWPDDPELGWGVDPPLWGRGYATEAALAALEHAWTLGIPRVVSLIHPQNTASIRVAEKLGESPHSTVRWPDADIDLLVYGVETVA